MNGRVYEPLTGMFLSPDNYIQNPGDPLNYNRYSYCLNNPLIYTDPSGELFGFDDALFVLAMAYFGGMQANFIYAADNGGNDVPLGGVDNIRDIAGTAFMANGLVNVASSSRVIHGTGGSWGDESFWGDMGFARKALDWILAGGPAINRPYIGGTVPSPNIGRIGTYAEMTKLTKGYKGAIQAHHLVETRHLKQLGLSAKEAPTVILDRATHQSITNALRAEMPYGQKAFYTTEQMMSSYERIYSDPTWLKLAKALLDY